MSQSVDLVIVVKGMGDLMAAIVEGGFTHESRPQFQDEQGRTHAVDLVVRDDAGTRVGVKVDEGTGTATFVGHDASGRAQALANRVAQRYAYSKVTQELKRKGYQIAKEEKQKDGTIKLVAQRWR
jgi:hypothetical protein